jgi:hypothetical protein
MFVLMVARLLSGNPWLPEEAGKTGFRKYLVFARIMQTSICHSRTLVAGIQVLLRLWTPDKDVRE